MTPTTEQSRRSPRQARSAETRRKLLDAGFEAFAAKGHDGVNLVDDVLEPAGISIGSFYHQFADKTELLREILAEAAARRRAFIVGLGDLEISTDLATAIRFVVERLYASLETDTTAWQLQRVTRVTGVDGVREMGSSARENWTDERGCCTNYSNGTKKTQGQSSPRQRWKILLERQGTKGLP